MNRRLLTLTASGFALLGAPAVAQTVTQPLPATDGTVVIDDVIVTALRRAGTVQTTPASVTAVDGETLARTGRTTLGSLRSIPGVTAVEAGPGNTRMVIRGIQSVGEATVGVYYDDAPVTGVVGTQNDAGATTPGLRLFDVERVEVLRGPQGTLYGSGSVGGAVKIVFNKPSQTLGGAVSAQAAFGEGGPDSLVQGMINVPISPRLAVRAVGFSQQQGGWIDNPVLGQTEVNDAQVHGGRLLLKFDPSDRLHLLGEAHYQSIKGDRPFWTRERGPYVSNSRVRLPSEDRLALFSLSADYEFDGMVASAIVSHQDRSVDQASGDPSFYFQALINNPAACSRLRGGGAPCSPATQTAFNSYVSGFVYGQLISYSDVASSTAEVRLASEGDSVIDWTVGLFTSVRDSDIDNNQLRADPLTGEAVIPFDRQTRRLIHDELGQTAAFGELSVELTPRLTVSAGGRYFDYRRRVGGATVVPLDLINARLSTWSEVKSREDGWVGRVNLAYEPDNQTLLYVQASQGFRPGGVNQVLGLPADLAPYASDEVVSYEVGAKRRWLKDALTTNLSIYRLDWQDMQVAGSTTSGPFIFVSNAGAARIHGAELEIAARPIAGLEITAGASFVDGVLTEAQLNTQIIANGQIGDRIPYVPELTLTTGVNYSRRIAGQWLADADVLVSHVGESFSEFRPTSPFYRRLDAYTLVRMQLGLTSPDDRWRVEAFVDNATDEVAPTSLLVNGVTTGQTITTSLPPRRIGIRLNRTF